MKIYNIIEVLNSEPGTKFKAYNLCYKDLVTVCEEKGIKILCCENGAEIRLTDVLVNATFVKLMDKEVNWNKVPKGTKVRVRDEKDSEWLNRYFVGISENEDFPFTVSEHEKDNDFTGIKMDYSEHYKQCEIHPSEKINESWYY